MANLPVEFYAVVTFASGCKKRIEEKKNQTDRTEKVQETDRRSSKEHDFNKIRQEREGRSIPTYTQLYFPCLHDNKSFLKLLV